MTGPASTGSSTVVGLDPDERARLLSIAREAIACALAGRPAPALADLSPRLAAPGGAFVSLHIAGRLRGCIGRVRALGPDPIAHVIQEMARAASMNDPRFDPLAVAELPGVELEISVLSPFEVIGASEVSRVVIGRHGLYISQHGRAGLLLPQVAPEWGWGVEEFLDQTCHKAGLPPSAWRNGAKIEIFSAEVFSETKCARAS